MKRRPILYDYWRSSAAYRVRIALKLKGVDYESRPVDLVHQEQASDAYRAINPQGMGPTLEIDGHRLTQSLAIINYLDIRYPVPPLIPTSAAERAHVVALAMAIVSDIHPLNNLRVLRYLKGELGHSQEEVDRWYAHWLREGFTALEALAAPRAAGASRVNRVDTMTRGMGGLTALDSVEIPSLEGKVRDEEWAIRVDLACAYRMIAHYGWDDLIFTHLSARIPGPENHFLLNLYNLMIEEVTASSLIKVDVHGNPVDPPPFVTNPAGFTIHSALHMAREAAHAVMHIHTPQGQAVSAHAEGLLPLTQAAMIVREDIA